MVRSVDEIDPRARYTAREACRFIPSVKGEHLHIMTWYRWRKAGFFQAFRIGGVWYMWGAEILKLLHIGECPEWTGRTPAQREKALAEAEREYERLSPRARNRRKQTDASEHKPSPRPAGRARRPRDDEPDQPPGP